MNFISCSASYGASKVRSIGGPHCQKETLILFPSVALLTQYFPTADLGQSCSGGDLRIMKAPVVNPRSQPPGGSCGLGKKLSEAIFGRLRVRPQFFHRTIPNHKTPVTTRASSNSQSMSHPIPLCKNVQKSGSRCSDGKAVWSFFGPVLGLANQFRGFKLCRMVLADQPHRGGPGCHTSFIHDSSTTTEGDYCSRPEK